MSWLEANTALLARNHPGAAAVLGAAGAANGAAPLSVTAAASGAATLTVGGVSWHSRYDPARDARTGVEREVPADATAVIIVGFGLGYAAEAVLRARPGLPVLVIEPDPRVFRAALASRDLAPVLDDPRVTLWLDEKPEGLPRVLEGMPLARPAVLRLRPAFQAFPLLYRAPDEYVQSWLLRRDINTNTLARFGRLWVRNLCRNIRAFAASPGVALLSGAFDGLPGLVLAGGPTLDDILPLLPRLRERMVLVSVNTPLRPCTEAGVQPDLTVIVDPQYWASRYLDWALPGPGLLVAEPSTAPRALRGGGRPLFLCSSLFPLGEALESAAGSRGSLGAGGSVSTTAWDLARHLGCAPVYAAGLDLGFPGMRTHCGGVYVEDAWLAASHRTDPLEGRSCRALREAGLFEARSAGGGSTPTDRRMLLYKWWFENQLAMRPGLEAYTLSPRGAEIAGMRIADPRDLLDLPVRRREIDERLDRARGLATPPGTGAPSRQVRAVLDDLRAGLAGLEALAERGVRETEALGRAVEAGTDPRAPLAALDEIDAGILAVPARTIAGFLVQDVIQAVTGSAATPGAPAAVVERSRAIYGRIAESARWQEGLLARAARELEAGPGA